MSRSSETDARGGLPALGIRCDAVIVTASVGGDGGELAHRYIHVAGKGYVVGCWDSFQGEGRGGGGGESKFSHEHMTPLK